MIAKTFRDWLIFVLPIFLILVMLFGLFAIPLNAGMSGIPDVGIQVQNIEDSENLSMLIFYPDDGGETRTIGSWTLPSGASRNVYMPNRPIELLTNKSYAGVIKSEKKTAAVVRMDWSQTGGSASYSTVQPGKSVLVPLVLKGFANQTSLITVQNTDTQSAISDVKLTLYGRGESEVVQIIQSPTIEKGSSQTWSLNSSIWGTLPDNGQDLGVSTGFVGAMKIESATPLIVHALIDVVGTRGVTSFAGVPSNSADTKLFCPLIRASYYGDTGISIVNQGNSSAQVDITFRANGPNPTPLSQPTQIIEPNSSIIAFQGPGGNSRVDAGLPNGFLGSAVIESDQPILAVVNDTEFGVGFAVEGQGSYSCIPASFAAEEHYLPLVRDRHVLGGNLTTEIQIMNVTDSGGTATLSIQRNNNPALLEIDMIELAANGSADIYGSGRYNVPNWFGSATVTCTQSCVVLVTDDTDRNSSQNVIAWDRANYLGVPKPQDDESIN